MGNKSSGKWLYKGMTDKEVVISNISINKYKCWNWNGDSDHYGYGRVSRNQIQVKAHRFSYEAFSGKIPDGLTLDHLCRNRLCVNPEHLEAVTLAENKARGNSIPSINARKTHCSHGHPYNGENLKIYIRKCRVKRYCITCQKQANINRKSKTLPKVA